MNRAILRLAIPNILSNITIPLMGVVDTALMGNQPEPAYLAALGVGVAIFNFVYWGFGFLRMGTTGFTSQAYGKSDVEGSSVTLFRAITVAVVIGIILMALQPLIWLLGDVIIKPTGEVKFFAREYFFIRIWAAPANMAIMVITGWLLGMQNAVYAMIIAIAANVLNIGISLWLVLGFQMDIAGVAWGTVIAQYGGLLIGIGLLFKKYRIYLSFPGSAIVYRWEQLKGFFQVNLDIFLRTLSLIFAFTFFTAQSSRMGSDILAVNTMFLQMLAIVSYGIDGFAFAAESLTGRFFGMGDPVKLKRLIRQLFLWGIGFAIFISLLYLAFTDPIIRFFTKHDQLILLAKEFTFWIILAPLTNCFAYLWDGIYVGATASKPMRNAMFVATFLLYVPLFYLFDIWFENHGLWLAFTIFMVARGGFLWAISGKYIYRKMGKGTLQH